MSKSVEWDTSTRLYRIWQGIYGRCYCKTTRSYEFYGGRGITVCQEWLHNFGNFEKWANENGYSDELTLDRIDSSKGYSPENCRWATWSEQANNRSNNRIIEYNGISKTMAQWADHIGISQKTLSRRINDLGWSIDRAINTPLNINKSHPRSLAARRGA